LSAGEFIEDQNDLENNSQTETYLTP